MINVEGTGWKYVAEGNANIILSNNLSKTVIRVKKEIKRKETSHHVCKNENLFSSESEWEYINIILKRFFKNSKYLLDISLASVSYHFLSNIDQEIINDRPPVRRCKGIDTHAKDVMYMSHLGFMSKTEENYPSIFIEVKPKCVFLPYARTCHPIKQEVCRFCMHQVTKLRSGKVMEISEYCPLNLFSDNTCCLRNALESLFQTPQNNLIIYVSGNKVPVDYFDDNSMNITNFTRTSQVIDVLVKILFEDSRVNNQVVLNRRCFGIQHRDRHLEQNGETVQDCSTHNGRSSVDNCNDLNNDDFEENANSSYNFCQSKLRTRSHRCSLTDSVQRETMCKGGILKVIKSLQMLDSLDIEGILPIYNRILREKPEVFDNISNFNSKYWRDVVDYLTVNEFISDKNIDLDVVDICKYLISSTFKDCSIIITFQRNSNHIKKENNVYDEGTKSFYEYQIKLIDVDPRHVSNIPYYYQVDQEIVSNFMTESCNLTSI